MLKIFSRKHTLYTAKYVSFVILPQGMKNISIFQGQQLNNNKKWVKNNNNKKWPMGLKHQI